MDIIEYASVGGERLMSENTQSNINNEDKTLSLGIDVGSTTIKAVLREGEEVIFRSYERHGSKVRQMAAQLVRKISALTEDRPLYAARSGPASSRACPSCRRSLRRRRS